MVEHELREWRNHLHTLSNTPVPQKAPLVHRVRTLVHEHTRACALGAIALGLSAYMALPLIGVARPDTVPRISKEQQHVESLLQEARQAEAIEDWDAAFWAYRPLIMKHPVEFNVVWPAVAAATRADRLDDALEMLRAASDADTAYFPYAYRGALLAGALNSNEAGVVLATRALAQSDVPAIREIRLRALDALGQQPCLMLEDTEVLLRTENTVVVEPRDSLIYACLDERERQQPGLSCNLLSRYTNRESLEDVFATHILPNTIGERFYQHCAQSVSATSDGPENLLAKAFLNWFSLLQKDETQFGSFAQLASNTLGGGTHVFVEEVLSQATRLLSSERVFSLYEQFGMSNMLTNVQIRDALEIAERAGDATRKALFHGILSDANPESSFYALRAAQAALRTGSAADARDYLSRYNSVDIENDAIAGMLASELGAHCQAFELLTSVRNFSDVPGLIPAIHASRNSCDAPHEEIASRIISRLEELATYFEDFDEGRNAYLAREQILDYDVDESRFSDAITALQRYREQVAVPEGSSSIFGRVQNFFSRERRQLLQDIDIELWDLTLRASDILVNPMFTLLAIETAQPDIYDFRSLDSYAKIINRAFYSLFPDDIRIQNRRNQLLRNVRSLCERNWSTLQSVVATGEYQHLRAYVEESCGVVVPITFGVPDSVRQEFSIRQQEQDEFLTRVVTPNGRTSEVDPRASSVIHNELRVAVDSMLAVQEDESSAARNRRVFNQREAERKRIYEGSMSLAYRLIDANLYQDAVRVLDGAERLTHFGDRLGEPRYDLLSFPDREFFLLRALANESSGNWRGALMDVRSLGYFSDSDGRRAKIRSHLCASIPYDSVYGPRGMSMSERAFVAYQAVCRSDRE